MKRELFFMLCARMTNLSIQTMQVGCRQGCCVFLPIIAPKTAHKNFQYRKKTIGKQDARQELSWQEKSNFYHKALTLHC